MSLRERIRKATEQLGHLAYETQRLTNGKWWRWGNVWFGDGFWAIAAYRLSRSAFLATGSAWPATRVALAPLLYAAHPWMGGCAINYRADIGRGLRVLHPGLGVVISGKTIAGNDLVLVGGNCIGGRKALDDGGIVIGDNVLLGANACVLGPIKIGDDVRIGACAVVVRDVEAGAVIAAPLGQRLNSAS